MTTLDPANKSSFVDLSNGDLTAANQLIHVNAGCRVRSTTSKSDSRYSEVTIGTMNAGTQFIGVCNSSLSMSGFGVDPDMTCCTSAGTYYVGGSYAGTSPTFTTGDVVGQHVDPAQGVRWRVNGGAWTSFKTLPSGSAFYHLAMVTALDTGAADQTVNFGGTAFGAAEPSGSSAWDAAGGSPGSAGGAIGTVPLSAPAGAATGKAAAAGGIGTVSMTAPGAVATGAGAASGLIGTLSVSAPGANATGWAAAGGAVGTVTIFAPSATAGGAAAASGAIGTVSLVVPTGQASGAGAGFASGAVGTITMVAPTGAAMVAASATGPMGTATIFAPAGAATGRGSASGTIGTIGTIAPTAVATGGGFVYVPRRTVLHSITIGAARPAQRSGAARPRHSSRG